MIKHLIFTSISLLVLNVSKTSAADNGCWSIADETERLACYDKSHKEPAVVDEPIELPADDKKPATTKEVITAKPNDPPKRIDADDLAIAPNKYLGKNVELVKAQCFYADKDEYRCLGSTSSAVLMLVGRDITPETEKQRIENECGEIKKMPTPQCRRTLRFVPESVDHDTVGLLSRTVVASPSFEILAPAPHRK